MLTRRHLFQTGFATGCSMCASLVTSSLSHALAAQAAVPTEIDGPGYQLWFIGSLREAVMMGKRTALLDLRTLKDRPHLYGIGPIEGLAGEATIANGRPSLARVGADRLVVADCKSAIRCSDFQRPRYVRWRRWRKSGVDSSLSVRGDW